MRNLLFALFVVVLLATTSAVWASEPALPCRVAVVNAGLATPGALAANSSLSLQLASTHQTNCAEYDFTSGTAPISMQLYRIGRSGAQIAIATDQTDQTTANDRGQANLIQANMPKAGPGHYFASLRNGQSFLQEVHFSWGAFDASEFAASFDAFNLLPSFRATGITRNNGKTFFVRGRIPTSQAVAAYAYQFDENGQVTLQPGWLQWADQSEIPAELQGAPGWANVLKFESATSFNLRYPVSLGAVHGGRTVLGGMFDPSDPVQNQW